jgi:hypothetical protein
MIEGGRPVGAPVGVEPAARGVAGYGRRVMAEDAPGVMTGLGPVTHDFLAVRDVKSWMAGTSPAMTLGCGPSSSMKPGRGHRRSIGRGRRRKSVGSGPINPRLLSDIPPPPTEPPGWPDPDAPPPIKEPPAPIPVPPEPLRASHSRFSICTMPPMQTSSQSSSS